MEKLMYMTCCCCGAECTAYRQWHNRDNGYSICPKCIEDEKLLGTSAEELKSLYGKEGVHYNATKK